MEVRVALDADPRRVVDARRFTERALSAWGLADLCDVATLLVSELMTNAILHARSGVLLNVRHDANAVRIQVCDSSPLPPRVRHFRPDAGTGRGVRLLESLASTWGVAQNAHGKCVWFTLATGQDSAIEEWDFDFDLDTVEPL